MNTLQFLLRHSNKKIFNSSFVLRFDSIPDAAGFYSLFISGFCPAKKNVSAHIFLLKPAVSFIVSSYLRSSPTSRLNRNSAFGLNITSCWTTFSRPEGVLLCTYTIRFNTFLVFSLIHMLLQVFYLHLHLDGSIILSVETLKWQHLLIQKFI